MFIVPVLVSPVIFPGKLLNVPLFTLMVPLLLHDVVWMVVVPVPVCFVNVPVLTNGLDSELLPFMVIVPMFEMVPVPIIRPSFQTILPFARIVSDAFIVLLLLVFSVIVCPAPIASARPSIPLVQVMSPLMIKKPVPVIVPWIVNGLLIVRLPAPVMVLVLLKTNGAGNTNEMFKVRVVVLIKLPVPLITDPVL